MTPMSRTLKTTASVSSRPHHGTYTPFKWVTENPGRTPRENLVSALSTATCHVPPRVD